MNYLALDIGQVLCHLHPHIFFNEVSQTLNISVEDVNNFTNSFWEVHDLGHTTIKKELINKLNVKSEIILEKLADAWVKTIAPNRLVIDFVNMLREKYDVQIALLSNIGIEHAEVIGKHLSVNGLYDSAIKHFSYQVGARKPSYLYYQSFLMMHPKFKGCVYVDDLDANLITGEKLGFNSYKLDLSYFYGKDIIDLPNELDALENYFLKVNNYIIT